MSISKEAKVVKRKNKYCVVGHKKDPKTGEYRNFGCYDSKEDADKRLQQISMFKQKKALLLNIMTNVSDELERKGNVHIADAIMNCAEVIAVENMANNVVLRLKKIAAILEKKEEQDLSEQIYSIIPGILSIEGCEKPKKRKKAITKLSADVAYKLAKKWKDRYLINLINESSFEYEKMKEFESFLKAGFLLTSPKNHKIPEGTSNWWDYFSKKDE